MYRRLLTVLATVAALALAGASPAAAQTGTGSTPSAGNSCSNPRLAQNSTGWATTSGGSGSRQAVTGHVAAAYGYRVTTSSTRSTVTLPQQAVKAGQRWTFAFDTKVSGSTATVRVGVDWYNASGGRLLHQDGAYKSVTTSTWTRVAGAATAPTGATRVVVSASAQLARGAQWSTTACDYTVAAATTTTPPPTTTPPSTTLPTTTVAPTTVPPTTVPPTTAPTTTVAPTTTPPTTTTAPPTTSSTPPPPPPGDGVQAATVHGWTQRLGGDEFDGTAVDQKAWYLYDGVGHGGNGVRSPGAISVRDGVLTIAGTSTGVTGGMSMEYGRKYGRWEARMQVPRGDARYHPVLLLWPDAEDWPSGGEVDYAETDAASTGVEFFLHYSAQNRQTSAAKVVDLTAWHNYAVEWTSTGIRGYVDGVLFFTDTDLSHLPPRAMHQTIQLDWFPNGATPTTPSSMNVAWVRIYAA